MKSLSRIFFAAGAALILAGNTLAAEKIDAVRVTYVASPFNVPAIVMKSKGYLEEALKPMGIKADYPKITSGAKQIQALAAGQIQIASVLGGTSAILGRTNGVKVTVIAAFSRNPKAYLIMTKNDALKDVAALRGKTIAGPKGTTLHQMLLAALAKNGMTAGDVKFVNMDIPSARSALLAGRIDAALLAGNDALAVAAEGGKVLANGEGLIQPTSVIAASDQFVKDHPAVIKAYLAAHYKALDFMKTHPDDALKIAADEQKISLADAKKMMAWYDFSPRITDQDVVNLSGDQDFMFKSGMIRSKIDVRKDLIQPSAFTLR